MEAFYCTKLKKLKVKEDESKTTTSILRLQCMSRCLVTEVKEGRGITAQGAEAGEEEETCCRGFV
jgi:hypothetical protein